MAPPVSTVEQLLRIYAQQTKNLDDPDEPTNELLLVLGTRNGFEDYVLSEEQQQRLDQLDDELVKRWEILAEWLPNPNADDDGGRRWWWLLHRGPQVREEARALK